VRERTRRWPPESPQAAKNTQRTEVSARLNRESFSAQEHTEKEKARLAADMGLYSQIVAADSPQYYGVYQIGEL
jgi:hypothetical protein